MLQTSGGFLSANMGHKHHREAYRLHHTWDVLPYAIVLAPIVSSLKFEENVSNTIVNKFTKVLMHEKGQKTHNYVRQALDYTVLAYSLP